jgi:hypothetical protein
MMSGPAGNDPTGTNARKKTDPHGAPRAAGPCRLARSPQSLADLGYWILVTVSDKKIASHRSPNLDSHISPEDLEHDVFLLE